MYKVMMKAMKMINKNILIKIQLRFKKKKNLKFKKI